MSIEERAIELIGTLDCPAHPPIAKPVYKVGQNVYAPYTQNGGKQWYLGHITKRIKTDQTTEWGTTWKYNVTFDDGDKESGIEEEFVFETEEYLLNASDYLQNENTIQNIVDTKSSDNWAREVGWYEVSIDGRKRSFSLLKEAKKAVEESYGGLSYLDLVCFICVLYVCASLYTLVHSPLHSRCPYSAGKCRSIYVTCSRCNTAARQHGAGRRAGWCKRR